MATELKSLNENVALTQFSGGIQLTQRKSWYPGLANQHPYLTLTKDEVALLVSDLTEWLAGDLPESTD